MSKDETKELREVAREYSSAQYGDNAAFLTKTNQTNPELEKSAKKLEEIARRLPTDVLERELRDRQTFYQTNGTHDILQRILKAQQQEEASSNVQNIDVKAPAQNQQHER